jgi:hypothetical protein
MFTAQQTETYMSEYTLSLRVAMEFKLKDDWTPPLQIATAFSGSSSFKIARD